MASAATGRRKVAPTLTIAISLGVCANYYRAQKRDGPYKWAICSDPTLTFYLGFWLYRLYCCLLPINALCSLAYSILLSFIIIHLVLFHSAKWLFFIKPRLVLIFHLKNQFFDRLLACLAVIFEFFTHRCDPLFSWTIKKSILIIPIK